MELAGLEVLGEGEQYKQLPPEGDEQLLRIKLFVPLVCSGCVVRTYLIEQVNGCLEKALTLVSAPAGYGKTTLVSSWLRDANIPSAWLSLDEGDNDPICFLQYFITALHKIVPAIQVDLLGVLQDMQPAPYEALVNIIINTIAVHASPFVFVLDDFHVIHAPSVLQMIAHLLEHLPPQMHLLLLTRIDPPLPLSRLRARNQLLEIRAEQLRFSREEIAFFLGEVMGLALSAEDIAAMEIRTEGWIAGLQLAAIAMQTRVSGRGSDNIHSFVSAFTGSHYYIMDYLAEEVLAIQPEAVRSFLLQTSILERMCGPLCSAVVEPGAEEPVDGQAMLEALEQHNLFVIPLDNERHWYRYHHLFADVLNKHLEQQYRYILPELHRRASGWFEQNKFIFEAVRHSLLAGDQGTAARLIDQNGCNLLMRGETVNLLNWIRTVEPYSRTLPWIAIQKGWSFCLTGQLEQAEEPLQAAERLISSLEPSDEVGTMLGAVTAARAFRANMRGQARIAADLSRQALACLPAGNDFSCSLRGAATSILGDASWISGNLDEARRAYEDAVMVSQASGNIHMVIIANANLADVLIEQGQLRQAARTYSDALNIALSRAALPNEQISPLAERIYAGLGRISYEWNHLEDTEKLIYQCIELSQRWGSIDFKATGYAILAELERVRCNPRRALEAMHVIGELIAQYTLSPWRNAWIQSRLARLWIAQGDLEMASAFIRKCGIMSEGVPGAGENVYLHLPMYICLLRLHLARCEYDAALTLSEWLLRQLELAGQTAGVIEVLVLQSLACQGRRDMEQALSTLEKALCLAQPEGFGRVFLDEGRPMAKLLFQAKLHRIYSEYSSELLAAFDTATDIDQPPAQLLIEPLTLREIEVLKLIEAGNSNQDIADGLVISMPTVKRHISNIYTKLGVESRTQAISLARELGLFN